MNKKALETFLLKYNLGGRVDSVRWVSDGSSLKVDFTSSDRNIMGFLQTDEIKIKAGNYDIFNTNELRSLLGILGDDIEIDVSVDKQGNPFSFILKDGKVKINFVLAEPTAIPKVPELKSLPTFPLVIKLDQKFIQTFVKSVGALRENGETFVVTSDGVETKLTIGQSEELHQTNVVINMEAEKSDVLKSAKFDTFFLKDLLQANKEMTEATLSVSEYGIACVNVKIDHFKVEYYLLKVNR